MLEFSASCALEMADWPVYTEIPPATAFLLLRLKNHLLHLHLIEYVVALHRFTQCHHLVGHEPVMNISISHTEALARDSD